MADPAPFHDLPPGGMPPSSCWWMYAPDGTRLRAAHWSAPNAAAHAIYLSGRTEFLEKASVPVAELVRRGYDVVSLDWRGQGLSDRAIDPPLKGHVGDFSEYQSDLDTLLSHTGAFGLHGPRVLFGHSMGGSIAAAALQRPLIAGSIKACVLSAPMFGIYLPTAMRIAAVATVGIGRLLGRLDRWPPFGDMATPYALSEPEENVLTHDTAFWNWMVEMAGAQPDLNLGMPTLGWFGAAAKHMRDLSKAPPASTPMLVLLGDEEAVVDSTAVLATSKRIGADVAQIPGGKHELLVEANAIRALAWSQVDRFLSQHGLPAADMS